MSESESTGRSGAQDRAVAAAESSPQSSQLSAMFDDALPAAECELLAKRLAADGGLQRQWSRYAVIGAALRGDPVCVRRSGEDVAARVAAALARENALPQEVAAAGAVEPLPQAAGAEVSGIMRWRRPLAATGIAAGVAALSLVWLQRVDAPPTATLASTVAPSPAAVEVVTPASTASVPGGEGSEVVLAPANASEPESYVVPALPASGAARPLASTQLANFVVAHSEFSGSLARRGMLSALVAGDAATDAAPPPAPRPEVVEPAAAEPAP